MCRFDRRVRFREGGRAPGNGRSGGTAEGGKNLASRRAGFRLFFRISFGTLGEERRRSGNSGGMDRVVGPGRVASLNRFYSNLAKKPRGSRRPPQPKKRRYWESTRTVSSRFC